MHHLLNTREAEADVLATVFSDDPPTPTDPSPFWVACGYNNDGLPFTSRAERLPGVVPRRVGDLGIPTSACAAPVHQSTLSRISGWIQLQSSRDTCVLVQVHYPSSHNQLYTLLSGARIDPLVLTAGLPRAERYLRAALSTPDPRQSLLSARRAAPSLPAEGARSHERARDARAI